MFAASGAHGNLVAVKRTAKQTRIGEAGIALIHERVGEMGHNWQPTAGPDSGIDGEIELVDPATDVTRNFRIGVQSKATEGRWRSETDDGFLYRPKPEDLEFWLGSNQPILLVCSRPRTGEAYFRNVQEWAKDPARRASGLIDFDKHRDRFDVSATARFFVLDARDPLTVDPPGPLPVAEQVLTNMLPVRWDVAQVWSTVAPSESWGELFARALDAGVARSDVALHAGRLWSLSPVSGEYLDAIEADEPAEPTPLVDLAVSLDRKDEQLLAELARRSLLNQHHRQLRWFQPMRAAYFRLWEEGHGRRYAWTTGKGRTVVSPRASRKHDGLSGYRHDAAVLRFRRLSSGWVLSIEPTYLFTWDGQQRSSFHAEALKKLKAMEGAAAISQQLRMWAHLFTRPRGIMDRDGTPFHFGELITVEVPVSPPEAAWKKPPSDIRQDATEEAMTLFGDTEDVT